MDNANSIKGRKVVVVTLSVDGEIFTEIWESKSDAEQSVKEWMLDRSNSEELAAKINTLGIYEVQGFFAEETGDWFCIETDNIL